MNKKPDSQVESVQESTSAFEAALARTDEGHYLLRLYVSGLTPNSQRAIENVRKLCEEHLKGRFELEIIDIYQQPGLTRERQIVAVPTLIKELPLPLRKFIGDMSQVERIIVGLDLRKKG